MVDIIYQGNTHTIETGENLLSALLSRGEKVPHACRSGICHSCMLCIKNDNKSGNHSINNTLSHKNAKNKLILACQTIVDRPLELCLPSFHNTQATIVKIHTVSELESTITLMVEKPLTEKGITSIAISYQNRNGILPVIYLSEKSIQCHVKREAGNSLTEWLIEEAAPGNRVSINCI